MPIRHPFLTDPNVQAKSSKNLTVTLICAIALAACGEDSPSSAAAAAPPPPATSSPLPGTGSAGTPSQPATPGVNSSPTIQGSPQAEVLAGQTYDFSPSARDSDGDPLAWFIVNRPAWATFDAATGRLHGRPSAADLGSWPGIQIGASDGTADASLPLFAITVEPGPGGAVVVGWNRPVQNTDSSSLTDLAGYRVYWGTDPHRLESSATIQTVGTTNYRVEPLPSGTWYFVVTAFNDQNIESDPSDPVVAVVN